MRKRVGEGEAAMNTPHVGQTDTKSLGSDSSILRMKRCWDAMWAPEKLKGLGEPENPTLNQQ
jgi:hypothetical protein